MQPPSLPDNEQQRLQTLRGLQLLDSGPDERFDRLTRLAMHIYDVPIALVSLVDAERQWFKSSQGLDVCETPREVSFCGHALLQKSALVVEDALQDSRFADNPLVVAGPGIRFYAGHPICYLDGSVLGTLCVIDHQPRVFSARDRLVLEDLAMLVQHEIQATQLATVDELTGIDNRRGFLAAAGRALSLSRRHAYPVCLVFVDLNRFKEINDRFGHREGDQVLSRFARFLRAACRESDLVARLGGDEFVVLLNDAGDPEVDRVLSRLAGAVEQDELQVARPYRLRYSWGILQCDPERQDSLEDLLAEADALMYRHKRGEGAGS